MRILEAIALLFGLTGWLWPGQQGLCSQRLVYGAAVLALIGHLFWEGPRWQMFPAYLVVLVGVIGALWPRATKQPAPPRGRVLRWTGRARVGRSRAVMSLIASLPPAGANRSLRGRARGLSLGGRRAPGNVDACCG